MYTPRTLTWLREDADNRPWIEWSVPIASRPAQEVRWRDVIILDQNNEFVAVQNLDDSPLTFGDGRTLLTNVIRQAATINDTDIDGLPDQWEFDQFGDIATDGEDTTDSGLPALLAYAFSASTESFSIGSAVSFGIFEDAGDRYFELNFRRRLGGEGERLDYLVEVSSDGGSNWAAPSTPWQEASATNLWDGTGTEMVTMRSTEPIAAGNDSLLARVRIEVPLF